MGFISDFWAWMWQVYINTNPAMKGALPVWGLVTYFFPLFTYYYKSNEKITPEVKKAFWFNLFTGWTIIGFFGLIVLAFIKKQDNH